MTIRGRDEALAAFDKRKASLAKVFQDTFDEFYEKCGSIAVSLEGWTRAGIIRDLAKAKLIALAAEDDGIRCHRKGNATSFTFGGLFNLQVKKLTDKLRARARTKASRDFDRNQGTLVLDDQPTTNVYLGHAPSENDPKHPPFFIVCNDENGRPAWDPIPILPTAAVVAGEITPTAKPEKGRVKIKPSRKRETNG